MTGERMYALYCKAMANLPYAVTKGEALPAWDFIGDEMQAAYAELAQLVKAKTR